MKSGFVSIIGRPNVGKSSLINKILNESISIVSEKPQTTRNQIKGIYNDHDCQIVFIDTPGIHKPRTNFGKSLNKYSYNSIEGTDLILFLSPIDEKIKLGDKLILEKISQTNNLIIVITKADIKNHQINLQEKIDSLKKYQFLKIFLVSIFDQLLIKNLIVFLKENLPNHQPYYATNQITDQKDSFTIKEIIREFAIKNLYQEIPHSIGIVIENITQPKEINDKMIIDATIYVEKDSQKKIVIGEKGKMIKKIGVAARKKLAWTFNQKTTLNLKVKVAYKWRKDVDKIKKMGY